MQGLLVDEVYIRVYISVLRYIAPTLAGLILWRVCKRQSGLGLLTLFQVAVMTGLGRNGKWAGEMFFCFGGLVAVQWALHLSKREMDFWAETGAFFLCTMGFCVVASVSPEQLPKQLGALTLGVLGYGFLRSGYHKWSADYAALLGVGLMVIPLIWGQERFGAKSWIEVGDFSFQPSELGKVCLVSYVANMPWEKRDRVVFWLVAAVMFISPVLMNDLGTAAVFFAAVWMAVYVKSGIRRTLGISAAGIAGGLLGLRGHAVARIRAWRHIWEYPRTLGYQQTKALSCLAGGGLLGLGAGQGRLKAVFSADADLVFATMAEEWGLVVAAISVMVLTVLVVQAIRKNESVEASVAGTILLVQTALNVLGTVDVLPMTGVTFPFVSNGGSSMVATWGLLAFLLGERRHTFARHKEKRQSGGAAGGVVAGRDGLFFHGVYPIRRELGHAWGQSSYVLGRWASWDHCKGSDRNGTCGAGGSRDSD